MPACSSIRKEFSSPSFSVKLVFCISNSLGRFSSCTQRLHTSYHLNSLLLFPSLETFADSFSCNPGSALESSASKSFRCQKLLSQLRQLSKEYKSLLFTLRTGLCLSWAFLPYSGHYKGMYASAC